MNIHLAYRASTLDPALYSRSDKSQWLSDWSKLAAATALGLAASSGLAWTWLLPCANQRRQRRRKQGSRRNRMLSVNLTT